MAKGMNVKKMIKGVNVEQVVVCILVVVLVVLVVYYVNKNSEGFNNDNSKPTLYFFYVDWCPHCTRAKETTFNDDKWNTVDNKDSVNLVKVVVKSLVNFAVALIVIESTLPFEKFPVISFTIFST